MIDTNQINQVMDVAKDIHAQVQTNWPAISAVLFIVARELKNFNDWIEDKADLVIDHGGIGMLLKKLVWNPTAASTPNSEVK